MNEDICSTKERYDHLYQKAIELFEEGSLTNESYSFACHALEEALPQLATINPTLKVDKENVGKNILHEKSLLDPQVSETKGAPKRMKSGIEKGRKRTSSGKVKMSGIVQREAINTLEALIDEVLAASTTRMAKQ